MFRETDMLHDGVWLPLPVVLRRAICCLILAACFILAGTPVIWGQTDPAAGGVPPPAAPATPEAGKPEVPEPLPVSLFFSGDEQQRIRTALAAYEKSKLVKMNDAENKANDFLNQLTDSAPKKEAPVQEKTFVYPQFFLSSLVYNNLNDWVVLINGRRFSSRGPMDSDDLSVIGVDAEKVTFQWKPARMDKVKEQWSVARNEDADVDLGKGLVVFTLRPNQTFSSYVMRVLEGRVIPVMVILKVDENGNKPNAAPPPDNKNSGDTQGGDDKNTDTGSVKDDVGIKGLNKTYKKLGLEE